MDFLILAKVSHDELVWVTIIIPFFNEIDSLLGINLDDLPHSVSYSTFELLQFLILVNWHLQSSKFVMDPAEYVLFGVLLAHIESERLEIVAYLLKQKDS